MENTFGVESDPECTKCHPTRVSPVGSNHLSDCVCGLNRYSKDNDNLLCPCEYDSYGADNEKTCTKCTKGRVS